MIFKKISCHHFSFFAETIPGLECFLRLHQVTCHYFRVGEYNVATKNKLVQKRQFEKSDFLGFTPKSLLILDFRVQHWNNAKYNQ